MDIITFNNESNILIEKYAPTKISEVIGSKKQIYELVEWLKKYKHIAHQNLQKIIEKEKEKEKKSGKKGKKETKKKTIIKKKIIEDEDDEDEEDGDIEIEDEDEDDKLSSTGKIQKKSKRNDTGVSVSKGKKSISISGSKEDDLFFLQDDEQNNSDVEEVADNKKTKKKNPDLCSCAVITGDHGTGKTAMVRATLNGLGYQIKSINFAKMGIVKNIDDFIENLLIGDDVYETMEKKRPREYAIIVDEVQSVSTPIEKCIVAGLLKQNSEKWGAPVIFIGSNKHKKIMSTIKKECYHISMYAPDDTDMVQMLERVGLGEEMKFENPEVIQAIITHSQSDYRRLIVTMGELNRLYNGNVVKEKDFEEYMKYTEEKDMDRSIFENTNRLFSKYTGINSALKIFENEKTNIPLMVHQNHFLATTGYIKDKTKLVDLSSELTENLAHGDVVDNYIYSDQNWSLQETHGFYTCVYPSFKMNQNINTEKLSQDSQYPIYRPIFSSQYPKDLNRTSTRCINYKNVKFANEYFKDMTIDDYMMTVKLVKNLLEDGRESECKNIMKEYNLTENGYKYVLKIDKINGTRKDISKTIEKKIKEIAVEPIKAAIVKNNKR